MKTPVGSFTDEELTAFLDGEADTVLSHALDQALEHDDALAQRLAVLDATGADLQAAFALDRMNAPAMPTATVVPLVQPIRRFFTPLAIAASFAAGLMVTQILRPAPTQGWMDQVASYQALYVAQTLAVETQDPALVRATLARSGIAHTFDTAPEIEGLEFKRAQILSVKGTPLIQLAYVDDNGTPFALCLTPMQKADKPVSARARHDLAAADWITEGIGYVLIGGTDQDQVAAMAQGVSQAL
jgi:anti-sigma factor RsiW